MTNLWFRALVAGLFLLLHTPAFATDFAVSVSGSDTASCGVNPNPKCETITFALGTRASAAPDKVLVMDGTYDTAQGESFPIMLKTGVSVIGNVAMPENVIVRSPADAFHSAGSLSASTVISGLTMIAGTTDTSSSSAIRLLSITGSDVVKPLIEHNRFITGGTGVDVHLTESTSSNSAEVAPLIRNNFFSGQTYAGVHYWASRPGTMQMIEGTISDNTINSASDGIYIEGTSSAEGLIAPTIKMNRINDALDDGIDVALTELDGGDNSITFQPLVTQNTITNPGDDGVDIKYTQNDTGDLDNGIVNFKPSVTSNTITGSGGGDNGVEIEVEDFTDTVDSLSLAMDITVTGNTVTGMGGDGIYFQVRDFDTQSNGFVELKANISDNTMVSGNGGDGIVFDLDDWSSVASIDIGPVDIKGNTVSGNGGTGIAVFAQDIDTSADGFDFSPTIANNTVTGNLGSNTGIVVKYSDSGAIGTALLSNNTVTGNNGTGILLLFGGEKGEVGGPAKAVLRGNTIFGNGGDAILISGSTSSGSVTANPGAAVQGVNLGGGARGDYEVDLGGGFLGGNGLNLIHGNTAAASGGSCAGGGFCDVNNNGPEDVPAVCNRFTESNMATEEDWLNDDNDDSGLGDITPISYCEVITVTPTATSTPTTTPTATETPTPQPDGADCSQPSECISGFCSSGVCCESACDGATDVCSLPGQEGICIELPAPAPAASPRGLMVAIAFLLLIAGFALARIRREH